MLALLLYFIVVTSFKFESLKGSGSSPPVLLESFEKLAEKEVVDQIGFTVADRAEIFALVSPVILEQAEVSAKLAQMIFSGSGKMSKKRPPAQVRNYHERHVSEMEQYRQSIAVMRGLLEEIETDRQIDEAIEEAEAEGHSNPPYANNSDSSFQTLQTNASSSYFSQ